MRTNPYSIWDAFSQGLAAEQQLAKAKLDKKYGDQLMQQKLTSGDLSDQLMQSQIGLANMKAQQMPLEFKQRASENEMKKQLLQAQIEHLLKHPDYRAQSAVGKMQEDLINATNQFGKDSPQAGQIKQAIQMALQGKQPLQVFDPNTGRQLVSMGGTMSQRPSSSLSSNYVDPVTGEIISPDTPSMRTRDIRGLAGSKNVQQLISQGAKAYAPMLNPAIKYKISVEKFINDHIKSVFKEPSEYAYGKKTLESGAEGLVNQWLLNPTQKNVDRVVGIVEPVKGETPEGYKDRIRRQLMDYLVQEKRTEQRLSRGIGVGQSPMFNQGGQQDRNAAKQIKKVLKYKLETKRLE